MSVRLILVINPGSTSTKFAVFDNDSPVFEVNLPHPAEDLAKFKSIADQFDFRKKLIIDKLKEKKIRLSDIKAVVGRGGLVKPIESGVYEINERMISDLTLAIGGEHASNLGALIARDISMDLPGSKAYIVDPVVVDELQPEARITGFPEVKRVSVFHALNQKAVARTYALSAGRLYEEMNLIIAHMGGGISIGAHRKGKVVDVNNALNGDGPLSPERAGTIPAGQLADVCYSGKYKHSEIKSIISGKGGMVALLGTNSFKEICARAEAGDTEAIIIIKACGYQTAKYIGAMAAVLEGKVDAIILTGGMAHQESHVDYIKSLVCFIAPVVVYAGEDELRALAFNAILALDHQVEVKIYK